MPAAYGHHRPHPAPCVYKNSRTCANLRDRRKATLILTAARAAFLAELRQMW